MNGAVETYAAPAVVERIQRRSLIIGGVAAALCVLGAVMNTPQFFRSYLLAFVFWIGISLGCLALLMLQYLSGGVWGLMIRRLLEAAVRVLPLMAVLFLPFAFGMGSLYVWSRPEALAGDALLAHKTWYLSVSGFWFRAAAYFAIWILLAYFLTRWSREQDAAPRAAVWRRLEGASAPGLILYGLTVTFASIDWVMSLDPHWFSTIFGVLFMGGQALSAMSFAIAMAVLLARHHPMLDVLRAEHLHDLGKLLMAFVMLWAYFSFSQLLIIWSGNLPEEIPWYVHRFQHGWQYVGLALVVFHFALPFLLLLSRDLKLQGRRVAMVASFVVVMRVVDLYWLIAPNFSGPDGGLHLHWLDVVTPVAVGGLWMAVFLWNLKQAPLLPLNDPLLAEAMGREHESV